MSLDEQNLYVGPTDLTTQLPHADGTFSKPEGRNIVRKGLGVVTQVHENLQNTDGFIPSAVPVKIHQLTRKRTRGDDEESVDYESESVPVKKRKTMDESPVLSSIEQRLADFESVTLKQLADNLAPEDRPNLLKATSMAEYADSSFRFWVEAGRQDAADPVLCAPIPGSEGDLVRVEMLLDWLVEIHFRFNLRSETLHLAASLLVRYVKIASHQAAKEDCTPEGMCSRFTSKTNLQVSGLACLLVASKVEEVLPPDVRDLQVIASNLENLPVALAEEEVLLLNTLGMSVSGPDMALRMLDRLSHLAGLERGHRIVAQFLIEVQLVDQSIVRGFSTLERACAALYLARRVLRLESSWPDALRALAVNYPETALLNVKRCARAIIPLLELLGRSSQEATEYLAETERQKEALIAEGRESEAARLPKRKWGDSFYALRRKYSASEYGKVFSLFATP